MATATMPFDLVQQNMTQVSTGIAIAGRVRAFRRFVSKLALTFEMYNAVDAQSELLMRLRDEGLHYGESYDLMELADNLDELNRSTALITGERDITFWLWRDPLKKMAALAEEFDCLAESFRDSASEQHPAYVGDLVRSAEGANETTEESWSDFVASLQD